MGSEMAYTNAYGRWYLHIFLNFVKIIMDINNIVFHQLLPLPRMPYIINIYLSSYCWIFAKIGELFVCIMSCNQPDLPPCIYWENKQT